MHKFVLDFLRIAVRPGVSALVVAIATVWLACADSAGPNGRQTGRLTVIPSFDSRASFTIDVRSIEISLTRLDGTVAVRDSANVPAGTKDVEIVLQVPLSGPSEEFDLRIILRDVANQVVYRNEPDPRRITVSTSSGTTPVQVAIAYVGPGNEAETISIIPVDPTVLANETVELTAVALDAQGDPVIGMPVEWSVLDPLVTIQQAGPTTPSIANIAVGASAGVARIEVRDARGNADTTNVTVRVNAPPAPVTIDQPAPGSVFTVNDTVAFQGTASDPEDGALTGSALVWTSDVDGVLGSGESVTRSDLTFGSHVITLTATDSEGASNTATTDVTIDGPDVSFEVGSQSVAENAGTVNVTVTLSFVSSRPVTIPFTVTGTATQGDYTISSSPLAIAAGLSSADISISVLDNPVTEPDRTVIVTMGTPTNAKQGAITEFTLTIIDDEGIPLSGQETIFNFDFTGDSVPPPYDAIRFGATFSLADPVSGTDVMFTNVYGDVDGTQLVQNRNDTSCCIRDSGTTYGPLTTANPIFDPMLDGIFSFGLVMNTGTALLRRFEACGVVQGPPFRETCRVVVP